MIEKELKNDDINNGALITQPPIKQNQIQSNKNINNMNNIINKNSNSSTNVNNNINKNNNLNVNYNSNINLNNNVNKNNNNKINNNINKNINNNISKNNNNNINKNIMVNNNINSNANKNININSNANSNINKNTNINNIIKKNNIIDNNINNKKSSITVAIRVRPLNQNELELSPLEGVKVVNNNSLIVTSDTSINSKKTNQIKEQQFFFDYVFDKNSSQQTIYEYTTKNLLSGVIEGFNATVFAYGATGSGKTYTMLGTSNEKGIMSRSIADLFKLLNNYKNKEYKMEVSYIEIYNEIIRDLLAEGNVIDIYEDPGKGVILQGVNEIEVENTENFYDLLFVGNKKRTTGSTNNNETSSRSHAVLRISLNNKDKNSNDMTIGRFILVDLAGSEKTNSHLNNTNNNNNNNNSNNNNTNNIRQNEGSNINKSLLALGVCINALASKSKFIPWRNSKLTRILKDSLGGNGRIVMISTISPSVYNLDETINTLVYSNRAKNIQTIIKKNVISSVTHDNQVNKYDEIISNLTSELQGLRQQLAEKTHKKHLLPKKEFSSPNILMSGASKLEKLSKEIDAHFNEEKRLIVDILETKKNINNLISNLKEKEFSLYKLMNKSEINKSSSAKNILKQNYFKKNNNFSSVKEKEIKSQINKINNQIMNQKESVMNKENRYNELVSRRSYLENAIGNFGSSMNLNSNSKAYNINNQNFSALQYLYQSYVLEINNMENDYLRKESLNEIRSKDIKIKKLVEQLKIRDEYISQGKNQLSKKNIKYYFEGEKDIKKLEELNIDKNFSLPFIIQQENRIITKNISSFNLTKRPQNNTPNVNMNKVNLISSGKYDYSGYCNPNIIKEKRVIKTKTNEIMRKTKKSQLSELKLNILNDQYKNSKVFYVNKGTNPNLSFSEEPNVITFDTRKLNKSQSNASFSQRSNDSLNASTSNRVFNYKEREIDNKIKRIMVLKKRKSPYMK